MKNLSIGDALAILACWVGAGLVACFTYPVSGDSGDSGLGAALTLTAVIMACCLSWQIIKLRKKLT